MWFDPCWPLRDLEARVRRRETVAVRVVSAVSGAPAEVATLSEGEVDVPVFLSRAMSRYVVVRARLRNGRVFSLRRLTPPQPWRS